MINEINYNDEELTLEIKRRMAALGNKEKAGLAKIIQADILKELTDNLKNFDSITQEQWKSTINKLKNYKKMIKIDGDNFNKFIETLLPLLGAFLGCMFTFKNNKENTIEAASPEIQLPNSSIMTTNPDDFLKQLKRQVSKPNDSVSYIPTWCEKEINGFSYSIKDESTNSTNNIDNDNCRISLCPPEEKTNFNALNNISPIKNSKGIVVEYDSGYPHHIKVQTGSEISFNQNIGNIEDLPVKSQIRGMIVEKTKNYFIADYIDEAPEIDSDNLLNKYDNKEMDSICDLFNNNANITSFIKDYLLELRIPALSGNKHSGMPVTTKKCIKVFRKEGRKIQKKYEKKVKKACAKKTVEAYSRKSKLNILKEKLDEYKKETFEQIIELYNNYNKTGYKTIGRISDYMICDEYMDFLLDEEKFRYDDKNPYVVKLFKLICKFIGTRSKIEKNESNLPGLIENFNVLCKQIMVNYWNPKEGYYNRLKDIFQYEYYTDNIEEIIEASVTDENAVSMYQKVYEYLKTVCNYKTPETKTIEYSDNIDIKALLNSESSDDTDMTMDSDLRKISYNFCMLRGIEISANDDTIYNTSVANRGIVNAFAILHETSGVIVDQYFEELIPVDPIIIASIAILKPYLKTLKKITQSETYELEQLGKEVISWYRKKGNEVNNPNLFKSFKEIPWGAESQIVYNNEYYDYVFLQYENNDSETMLKKAQKEPFDFDTSDDSDEYYNTLKYLKSAYGPHQFPYWLRYLSIATIVNCMLPIYWGTGMIVSGAPVVLPIIMLPIYVLSGRVTVVFGMGICGMYPMPLILFVNMGNVKGSILIPLNILADTLKKSLKQVANVQQKVLEAAYQPAISKLDDEITKYRSDLESLEDKIHNLDSYIKGNNEIIKNIKKRKGEDPTPHHVYE